MTAVQDAIAYANINVGLNVTVNNDYLAFADINVGVSPGTTETIQKRSAGWGVSPVPTGSFTKLVLSDTIACADINITT